jgi:hypothetical protein
MNRSLNVRILISLLFAFACAFIVYFLFVDRAGRKTYQAQVALDGKTPWGPFNPRSADPPDTVVVYRSVGNGVICFDAFHSKGLHDALSSKNGQTVTVEYDTFSDFGRVRGYNVHSVNGVVLANGYHVLRPEFGAISGVVGNTNSDQACW